MFRLLAIAILLIGVLGTATVRAELLHCPFESRFGKRDEVGASRTQVPAKVLEAIKLIDTGRVFGLAHEMNETTIARPFGRVFDVEASQFPLERQIFNTSVVRAHIGQLATQFDALNHAGHPEFGYFNCIPPDEVIPDENGLLQKLGPEKVKPFFTRAILLDFVNNFSAKIAGKLKPAGKILPASYVITQNDVMQVLEAQQVDPPGEGDVVIFYTGWDRFFGDEDGNAMLGDSPGIGVEVADWLASRKVAMVGADNLAVEAAKGFSGVDDFPPGHPLEAIGGGVPQPVHLVLLTQHGIHLLELMKLEELADAMLKKQTRPVPSSENNPYEFAFVYTPVPIKGLAGSPGRPLAID